MKTYTHAYIYLIREREFLLRDEPVFKIGRGEQDADRVVKSVATGYKKGSEIWLTIRCPILKYKDVESSLKSTFRERFTQHVDGSEYFSGDPTEMIKFITETVHCAWSDLAVEEKERSEIQSAIEQIEQQIAERKIFFENKRKELTDNWQNYEAAQNSIINQLEQLLAADIRSCSQ